MDKVSESSKGTTISGGIWSAQLYEHIKYFNSHGDLREIKMVLPFGIPRERKPKNWEKKQQKEHTANLTKIQTSRLGMFYHDPNAEIKEWIPRLKPMKATNDQVQNKPTLFILRHDPSEKKVMYLEQDLMAKPIAGGLDKKTGFTYRIEEGKNLVIRKYLVQIQEEKFIDLVHDFVKECNRVLYLYCDTI